MTKSMFFKIIKNIIAVICALILSVVFFILCCITYWWVTDSYMSLVEVHYEKKIPSYLELPPKEELLDPEFCIKTIKVSDNKNNNRYFYCRETDSISYGKNGEPISRNKVFTEYFLDENENITETVGETPVSYFYNRYVYNDKGELILQIYLSSSGPTNLHIYIYK